MGIESRLNNLGKKHVAQRIRRFKNITKKIGGVLIIDNCVFSNLSYLPSDEEDVDFEEEARLFEDEELLTRHLTDAIEANRSINNGIGILVPEQVALEYKTRTNSLLKRFAKEEIFGYPDLNGELPLAQRNHGLVRDLIIARTNFIKSMSYAKRLIPGRVGVHKEVLTEVIGEVYESVKDEIMESKDEEYNPNPLNEGNDRAILVTSILASYTRRHGPVSMVTTDGDMYPVVREIRQNPRLFTMRGLPNPRKESNFRYVRVNDRLRYRSVLAFRPTLEEQFRLGRQRQAKVA